MREGEAETWWELLRLVGNLPTCLAPPLPAQTLLLVSTASKVTKTNTPHTLLCKKKKKKPFWGEVHICLGPPLL